MKRQLTALLLFAAAGAWAQMTPVGVWHSMDDKTGELKAEIRIAETEGALNGRIENPDLVARAVKFIRELKCTKNTNCAMPRKLAPTARGRRS